MPDLAPRPAFDGLLPLASNEAAGVLATEETGLALATVLARRGAIPALSERVRALHGVELPDGPRVAASGSLSFVGTGPGAWLAVSEPGIDLAATLARDLAGLASVSDQSDGYAILRLSGPRLRDTMAKGFTIDLHPAAFGPGAAAVTAVAHMGAILWRLPGPDAPHPVFRVAIFRSYAGSISHWLAESAAEFGLAEG